MVRLEIVIVLYTPFTCIKSSINGQFMKKAPPQFAFLLITQEVQQWKKQMCSPYTHLIFQTFFPKYFGIILSCNKWVKEMS